VDHDTACELLGAYALTACDDAEAAAVEGHLHDCADCRAELSAIQQVSSWLWATGWLAVSQAATPPQWLRARILQEAEWDTTGSDL